MLQGVERRVDEADVGAAGLGLEQVARCCPGTRIMSPNEVKMTPGRLGDGDGVVDPAHRDDAHRAAGPVHQLDVLGQDVLDAVAVDGVGVAAAHLHELEVVVAGQVGDVGDEGARRGRVAVLVDEPHGDRPVGRRVDRRRPRRRRPRHHLRARQPASSSSIFDIANPTWISTQSPSRSSSTSADVDLVHAATSTRRGARARSARRSAGMPGTCVARSSVGPVLDRLEDQLVATVARGRPAAASRGRAARPRRSCARSRTPTWISTQSPASAVARPRSNGER